MARIKINDLPKDMKISKEDMRKITGGALRKVSVSPTGYTDPDGSQAYVMRGNGNTTPSSFIDYVFNRDMAVPDVGEILTSGESDTTLDEPVTRSKYF